MPRCKRKAAVSSGRRHNKRGQGITAGIRPSAGISALHPLACHTRFFRNLVGDFRQYLEFLALFILPWLSIHCWHPFETEAQAKAGFTTVLPMCLRLCVLRYSRAQVNRDFHATKPNPQTFPHVLRTLLFTDRTQQCLTSSSGAHRESGSVCNTCSSSAARIQLTGGLDKLPLADGKDWAHLAALLRQETVAIRSLLPLRSILCLHPSHAPPQIPIINIKRYSFVLLTQIALSRGRLKSFHWGFLLSFTILLRLSVLSVSLTSS